jgi:hypothetical protein
MRATRIEFSFLSLSSSVEEHVGVSIDKVKTVVRVQQISKLLGWSQESPGADEGWDVMPSAAVIDDLLGPRVISVKGGEPHPAACGLGDVHVGDVPNALSRKSSHVVNEHGVIWVIFR